MGSSSFKFMRIQSESVKFLLSAVAIPFLFLLSPNWLSLGGVGPYWDVLWLLPWSLNQGKNLGLFAGLCLGLLLDALTLNNATHIPALILLGYWWGWLGKQGKPIELSFNLGLLALLGSIICGASLWIQYSFLEVFTRSSWFHAWAFHTLLAQSIITGLLAPLVCSWMLFTKSTKRRPAK